MPLPCPAGRDLVGALPWMRMAQDAASASHRADPAQDRRYPDRPGSVQNWSRRCQSLAHPAKRRPQSSVVTGPSKARPVRHPCGPHRSTPSNGPRKASRLVRCPAAGFTEGPPRRPSRLAGNWTLDRSSGGRPVPGPLPHQRPRFFSPAWSPRPARARTGTRIGVLTPMRGAPRRLKPAAGVICLDLCRNALPRVAAGDGVSPRRGTKSPCSSRTDPPRWPARPTVLVYRRRHPRCPPRGSGGPGLLAAASVPGPGVIGVGEQPRQAAPRVEGPSALFALDRPPVGHWRLT